MCKLSWLSSLNNNSSYTYLQTIDIPNVYGDGHVNPDGTVTSEFICPSTYDPNTSYENLTLPLGQENNILLSTSILNINFKDFIIYIKHNSTNDVVNSSYDLQKISDIHNFYKNNKYEIKLLQDLILFFGIALKLITYTSVNGTCNIDINNIFLTSNTITDDTTLLNFFIIIHNVTNHLSNETNNRFLIINDVNNDNTYIMSLVGILLNIFNITKIKNSLNQVQLQYEKLISPNYKLLYYINQIKNNNSVTINNIDDIQVEQNIHKTDIQLIKRIIPPVLNDSVWINPNSSIKIYDNYEVVAIGYGPTQTGIGWSDPDSDHGGGP
jgi:hypothetical protein